MDLAMVKQEQGETLRKYMQRFFDKRATVVDVTDKEVIDLFQDGLYHELPSMPLPSVSTLTNSPRSPLPPAMLARTLGGSDRRRLEPAVLLCTLILRKKKGIFCLGPRVFP
jgi:hypothetical protein